MTIRTWIKNREIEGKPTFSIREIREAFPNMAYSNMSSELNRLSKQLIITAVYKSFYSVVPIQYISRGLVPPLFYIDQLMAYLGKPYYISLLSAAELHGAAHQRPQLFSVTTTYPKATTSKEKNNLLIWNYKRDIAQELLYRKNSETGVVKFSSPELTAVDLIQYENKIGGLSVAATVLEELLESTDFTRHFKILLSVTTIPTLQRLGYIIDEVLDFMPNRVTKQKRYNNTMLFRMESEMPPVMPIRLKVEINCFEHFNEMGLVKIPFSVNNQWFKGSCEITTYNFSELIGTKMRALYQRKKGRDLFDLYVALKSNKLNINDVIRCYRKYMEFVVALPPTHKQFILNMEEKMQDPDFIGDSQLLLRPEISFNPNKAYQFVKENLIDKLLE